MSDLRRRAVTALNRMAAPVIANQRLMRPFGITVCRIRYVGRRSGCEVTLPVWWRPEGGGGTIGVGFAQYKNWWRNFRGSGGPIEVTIDGVTRSGMARAVEEAGGKVHVTVSFDADSLPVA